MDFDLHIKSRSGFSLFDPLVSDPSALLLLAQEMEMEMEAQAGPPSPVHLFFFFFKSFIYPE